VRTGGGEDRPDAAADDTPEDRGAVHATPEPRPAPADDVLLAKDAVVAPEEGRPRDQPADDDVDQAAKRDDCAKRGESRPPPSPVVDPMEIDDERWARQDGDDGRCTRQSP
jgi:hypothetical protein